MKKASFITIHVGLNFGSVLQTIATSSVLKHVGVDPICINYIPPRVELKRIWKEHLVGLSLIKKIVFFPVYCYSSFIFKRYLKRYCKLSKAIYSKDDFVKKCPKSDYYITGSDQVWNFYHNEGYDGHYFFDGIEGTKISYAASIGMTNLTDEQKEILKDRLSCYSAISVREDSAKEQLKLLGLNATHVLDPTFMLNRESWLQYSGKRLVKEEYLFVYLPYNTVEREVIFSTINKIAKEKSLKIVSYSHTIFKDKDADETMLFSGPGDFLSLMYYADCVVTNSFHGTAFSINLNRQFWVYMPSKFSSRIISVLDLCGLSDRVLTDQITDTQMQQIINYKPVNEILTVERHKAINFLSQNLK